MTEMSELFCSETANSRVTALECESQEGGSTRWVCLNGLVKQKRLQKNLRISFVQEVSKPSETLVLKAGEDLSDALELSTGFLVWLLKRCIKKDRDSSS